jgi:N-acetylmuramoyl-L-alanine amidase
MSKTKIYIDAGHNYSGWNTGAIGNGMREQYITFDVAFALAEILKNDFDVKLSRPTIETNLGTNNDGSINARWQGANQWGADYFISIHVNAGGGTGVETFVAATKNNSAKFAKTINDTFADKMGLRNRGVKSDTLSAAKLLGVLRNTRMPAILVELAFIDSPLTNPDVVILRDKRKEMAQALAVGIYDYFGYNMKPPANESHLANVATVDELVKHGAVVTGRDYWIKVLDGLEVPNPEWLKVMFDRVNERLRG